MASAGRPILYVVEARDVVAARDFVDDNLSIVEAPRQPCQSKELAREMGEQADINGIAAPVKRKKRVVMIMTPEEELAAEKLKNQQLMSEMSDLKDKYNELETKFYDEPTVQQQPTNRDLQRKYETVCAHLDVTKKEVASLLEKIKELEKSLEEKNADIEREKQQHTQDLEKIQQEANEGNAAGARRSIRALTSQLKESEAARQHLQEILDDVLAEHDGGIITI